MRSVIGSPHELIITALRHVTYLLTDPSSLITIRIHCRWRTFPLYMISRKSLEKNTTQSSLFNDGTRVTLDYYITHRSEKELEKWKIWRKTEEDERKMRKNSIKTQRKDINYIDLQRLLSLSPLSLSLLLMFFPLT